MGQYFPLQDCFVDKMVEQFNIIKEMWILNIKGRGLYPDNKAEQ